MRLPAMGTQNYFAVFKDSLYFTANDGVKGNELWVSDGTKTGTKQVKDIWAGGATDSGSPVSMAARCCTQSAPALSSCPSRNSCCVSSP